MEISSTSFRNLLLHFSKAVVVKESTIDYANLLREIFEERDKYEDTAFADSEPQVGVQNSQILFGRYSELELLLSKLLDPHEKGIQLSAISITGDRGIGKTALARRVYDDVLVKKHFEVRVWVTVEGEEFKLQQAAQGILKSTMGMSCSVVDLDELDEMVRDTLNSQKCLIVFDGIESMTRDSWLHMNRFWFDFVDLGSKVLVTTPSKDVVDLVGNSSFELNHLSRDDSWFLCTHLAFYSSNASRLMADNLVSLCKGVPLLLKLVGSLMIYDHNIRDLLSSVDSLDDIVLPTPGVSIAIFLCVWALPSQLRQCFAYCAIFPKGYALNKEKIIHLWIAHGLMKPSPGNSSLEDIGNVYFLQLLGRSFFTDTTCDQYGDIIEFRIPSLIHDIGEHVAKMVYNEKLGLIGSIGEDAGQLSLLSFQGNYKSEELQVLMLASTLYVAHSLDHSFLDFHRLQSLDLSCSGIQNLSEDICALRELGFLNLSCTLLESLPDSIMNLSQLKILDLSWCHHLKVLPKGICELILMRHLDFSWCDLLSCLPSGIGFLRSLTSLPLFVLGKDEKSARLGELGQLNQLKGRLDIRNLENVGEITEARNAKLNLKNLEHLGLAWSHNSDDCFKVLELLQPNPRLKVLNITGYMGYKFPQWISSINSLIKISITDCACKKLPSLGQLPFLKELQLNKMMNLECIYQEFYGDGVADVFFPSLEQLELYDLPSLLEWPSARVSKLSDVVRLCCSGATALNASSNSVFRSLKTLAVEGCPKLSSLPSLPILPDLILKNNSNTILYSLTSFTSLSSLLINDMNVGQGVSFGNLGRWESLKKLVLCNIRDRSISFYKQRSLTALEHLGIIHCHELTHFILYFFPSLQKLHIVDCPNLSEILVKEENTQLMELVVEDCPRANLNISFHKFHHIRKLILKNCSGDFSMGYAGDFNKLEKLEYLSISGCLKLVSEFQAFPWLISHIPCIIVGNHKANFKDSKELREVLISASNELKSEVTVEPRDDFSHGPPKSITEQSIQNVMTIKYKEIKKATKNFGPDTILEKGGFRTVFKGWIHEHNLTAAKPGSGIAVVFENARLGYQDHEEWLNVVKYLSQLRHPNLVKLIGYCIEKEDRILVFEFMPKGSLASHLLTKRPPNEPPLEWSRRKRIALESARGLSFLHDHCDPKIIHRDVKAANIYLNEDFSAAVGNFFLAKPMDCKDTDVTTAVRGTIGHIAPEYLATGKVSEKTDVFGYGIMLLELITGKKAFDLARLANDDDVMLLDWVKGLFEEKNLERMVDPDLQNNYVDEDVEQLIQVALICTQPSPLRRPKMSEVVRLLKGD